MATTVLRGFISKVAMSLFANGSVIDANAITRPFAVANGWDSNKANFPSDFNGMFGLILSVPIWAEEVGTPNADKVQALILETGKVYARVHINNSWSAWATATS